ncbi:hypothetical protein [Kribbella kalugense]|uniref:Uncharacterized protein n=1 Tax=Kribbella kalugense TaxID=2512221 RepID=A0A4R7ZL30_9ACTN|nr:hypothetical protein [Kribbella kalugense]TDW18095.1 hypothetical protein EV650_4676 [Kribbella kalugense]
MSSPPPGPNYSWQPENRDYKSAPTYGQPPKKSRAGLIIALIVIFIVVALGAVGVLVQRLVSTHQNSTANPGPGTSVAPPPATKTTRPTAPKPTTPKPSTPAKTTPATPATSAAALGQQFVAQLNANNSKGAAALACKSSEQLIPLLMRALVGPPTNLTTGTPTGQTTTLVIPLSGTSKGAKVTGVLVLTKLAPAPLCVQAFQITTTH